MCGVAMVSGRDGDVASFLYKVDRLLNETAQRGKDSHGYTITLVRNKVATFTTQHTGGQPMISEITSQGPILCNKIKSNKYDRATAIVQNRWATVGGLTEDNVQPHGIETGSLKSKFAFNGNCPDFIALSEDFLGYPPGDIETDTGTLHSVFRKYLLDETDKGKKFEDRIVDTVRFFMQTVSGAHMAFMHLEYKEDGNVKSYDISWRSPGGERPGSFGKHKVTGEIVVASESAHFEEDFDFIDEVTPGELIICKKSGPKRIQVEDPQGGLCLLDFAYQMNPRSIIKTPDGEFMTVAQGRALFGKQLAYQMALENPGIAINNIVPIYDGGVCYADGFSEVEGLAYEKNGVVIQKNDIGRTYQESNIAESVRLMNEKFHPGSNVAKVKGHGVATIDDSCVKGTTIIRNADILRNQGGASAVHAAFALPPIVSIDTHGMVVKASIFRDPSGGIRSMDEVKDLLRVDTLTFLTKERIQNLGIQNFHMEAFDPSGTAPLEHV